jgi:carboxymethylenebutenolidase
LTPLQQYIAEEIAVDHADGLLTRREAIRRLLLLGLTVTSASALLAACSSDPVAPGAATTPPGTPTATATTPVATQAITFAGPGGRTLQGAWAPAAAPRGGVLVIHENKGLTDHIRSVAGRFGGAGYSALAIDLLSEEGGTGKYSDPAEATAALGKVPESRLIADAKAGVGELERRLAGKKLAAIGFCFGGGMVWKLLDAGEPRITAAAPFYGPAPDNPNFAGSKQAAVLGIYAEQDTRVNASRDSIIAALKRDGLTNEIVTYPGANHAFFNDTGPRYEAQAAAGAYAKVLAWFGKHLG